MKRMLLAALIAVVAHAAVLNSKIPWAAPVLRLNAQKMLTINLTALPATRPAPPAALPEKKPQAPKPAVIKKTPQRKARVAVKPAPAPQAKVAVKPAPLPQPQAPQNTTQQARAESRVLPTTPAVQNQVQNKKN